MTTNQTIDGVPRDLFAKAVERLWTDGNYNPEKDLAVLLDTPAALPRYMKSFHRVRRYNRLNLSLDAWKVIATHHRHYVYTYEAALAQDARVCAIEQELWQYEGLKRTPVRDRRVKKLVKILKRLKRGLYE